MPYLIEKGTDGSDTTTVCITATRRSALNAVKRIVGVDCFRQIKPLPRGKDGLLFNFVHEGRTQWLRILNVSDKAGYTLKGCTPVPNPSMYV